MINRSNLFAVASAAFCLTGLGLQSFAGAQEAPLLRPTTQQTIHLLRVKNVSASVMAWWLDPTHHQEPMPFQMARLDAAGVFPPQFLSDAAIKPLKGWTLPPGVQKVIGSEPQNAIIVFGTDAEATEIQKTIAEFDKPLPQVQVEVRYIAVSNEDVAQAGIVADAQTAKQGPWMQGEASANSLAKIDELVQQNKAKVIMAPRVTAISNLAAQMHSFRFIPAALGYEDGAKYYGIPMSLLPNEDKANLPNLDGFLNVNASIGIGFSVVPTINDDESISLLLAPGRLLQMRVPSNDLAQSKEGTPWQHNLNGIQTISNMKDGETVALMGGDSHLFDQMIQVKQNYSKVLILVTAHQVGRAE